MKQRIGIALTLLLLWSTSAMAAAHSARKHGMFGIGDHYPVVMMSVPGTDADFRHARKIGANYVFKYTLGGRDMLSADGIKRQQDYLDLAQKHGLKVMFGAGFGYAKKGAEGLEKGRQLVNRFKDHPALGFWYGPDEPDLRDYTAEMMKPYYQMLKQEAPDIPVCILTSVGPKWSDYHSVLDVYSYDTYPVGSAPFPQANLVNVVDYNEQAVQLGKPVLPCLQAFNWLFIRANKAVKDGTFDDPAQQKALKELRYPTREELRYWHFATLAQGARGVIYYSYTQAMQTDLKEGNRNKVGKDWAKDMHINPHWMDQTLKPAIGELKTFTDLVAPAWEHQFIPGGRTRNLLEGIWKRGDKTYVVLVNSWPLERWVTLTNEMAAPFQQGQAAPWGFSRRIAPKQTKHGSWVIEGMQPWEVLVWEIRKQH